MYINIILNNGEKITETMKTSSSRSNLGIVRQMLYLFIIFDYQFEPILFSNVLKIISEHIGDEVCLHGNFSFHLFYRLRRVKLR